MDKFYKRGVQDIVLTFFCLSKGRLHYGYIIYNNIRAKLKRKRAVEEGEGEKAVKKQGKNTGKPLEKHAPIKKQKKKLKKIKKVEKVDAKQLDLNSFSYYNK